MRKMNRLLLLVLVGSILAMGFALQHGENSTEIEKGAVDLKEADAESFIEQSSLDATAVDKNNDVDVDAGIVAVDVVGMTNREKGLFLLRMFSWARKENDLGFTQEHL